MINYHLLNKIILFTVEVYIDRLRQDKVELPKVLTDLKLSIITYKRSNMFTKEEADFAKAMGTTEELKEIVHVEVSHLLFILTVIKLWVEITPKKERPLLGISYNRLSKGRAAYAIQMLKLKQEDKESYEEKKQIIDISVETAKRFMDYHLEKLIK